MITQVVLKNFQSHKHSVFNFDKGLNMVVGTGNSGKTALIRALSLVFYNMWDKSWINWEADFCSVAIRMDSGISVIREKGPKVNKYILMYDGAGVKTFENFGTEVPEAVSKALKINKVQLDKDDSLNLNLSFQLDSLFLFNRSGSQKAKVFGRLSGAHFLDHALRSLSTEKKQTNTEKNLKIQELEALRSQHSILSKLYDYAPTMMRLIAEEGRIDETKKRVESLKNLLQRTQEWKRRYTSEMQKEVLLSNANGLESALMSMSVERLRQLKQLIKWKNDLEMQKNTLNSYQIQLDQNVKGRTDEYLKILYKAKRCPTCFEVLDEQRIIDISKNLVNEAVHNEKINKR